MKHRFTRKKRHEESVKQYKPSNGELQWIRFVEEGKRYFNDMLYNFESMTDESNMIKYFCIEPYTYGIDEDEVYEQYSDDKYIQISDEVYEQHNKEIIKVLVPWIKKEFEEQRLFQITNWKAFRTSDPNNIFLGYKTMFQYKKYYFQLGLDSVWNNRNHSSFILIYYGQKNEDESQIQSYNYDIIKNGIIEPNMIFTKEFWNCREYINMS